LTGAFDAVRSDIDLLVEFDDLEPVDKADAYFGLLGDLEALFGRSVDLVERSALRNPVLRRSVEASQFTLYEAA
jgi:predicted nucleotidyltransferase